MKPADFATDVHNDWCPGCGDFGILRTIQMALADLNMDPHRVTIVSGIGCSAKTVHSVQTLGTHTLHGCALPYSTAVKLANAQLNVPCPLDALPSCPTYSNLNTKEWDWGDDRKDPASNGAMPRGYNLEDAGYHPLARYPSEVEKKTTQALEKAL